MKLKIMNKGIYAISILALFSVSSQAEVTGYWRMEQDNNPGGGYSVTNEAGYNVLTGNSGSIDANQPDCVMTNRLTGGVTNNASLNGAADVSGTVASYPELYSTNITIEFFARTDEGDAGFFTLSELSDGQNFRTNGVSIVDPDKMTVSFAYDDGGNTGVAEFVTWSSLYNTSQDWAHYAFTYDAASGVATYYINGVNWVRRDGPDNRPLFWGAKTADIKIGFGLDGGGPFSTNNRGLFDELRISDTALSPAELLYKSVIARESFAITGRDGSYVENNIYDNSVNKMGVVGTVGFSVDNTWTGMPTGNTRVIYNGADGTPLSHTLLDGELRGAAQIKAKDSRNQHRPLSVAVPDSPVYYMCALLYSQGTQANENISIGFSDTAVNRNKGVHVGFNDGRLAVFAGNTAYDIMSNPYELNMCYLVVLRLTVNTPEGDVIDIYLAKNGAETIDFERTIEVETFSSSTDLANLKFIVIGNSIDTDIRWWWVDEVRLATEPAALGIDPALLVVQPPDGSVIIVN